MDFDVVSGSVAVAAMVLVLLAAAQGAARAAGAGGPGMPVELQCEYRTNPLGIDTQKPRLSWKVNDRRRGARQTAYQILVSDDPQSLARDQGNIWDSGKVTSGQSVLVPYGGPRLESAKRYYWKVRTWDADGEPSPYSEPAWWEMGLLDASDWKASWIAVNLPEKATEAQRLGDWIWHPTQTGVNKTVFFRKGFSVDSGEEVESAELRITADDAYTLYVNGVQVGSGNSWQTVTKYDVTRLVRSGPNVIAISAVNTGGPCGLIFSLRVRLTNGNAIVVLSDTTVKTSEREKAGWNLPDFNDSMWAAAKWVGAYGDAPWGKVGDAFEPLRSVMMRKEFHLSGKIASARVYVSGLGCYELRINGQRVGEDILTPGWTNYPTRIQYQVYDVTNLLRQGDNAAGVILGNGWWSSGLGWNQSARYSEGPLRFLMQLVVRYEDGSQAVIVTDSSWKGYPSPIVYNSLYHGETYDARLEQDGWDNPGFRDSHWMSAEVLDDPLDIMVAQQQYTIRCTEELKPVAITEPSPGVFVVDFGQNFAGRVRIKVSGQSGTKVVLRHAEVLNEDGTIYTANLRSARATDTYILKGKGIETWEPRFTYHGFRYVEISGFPGRPDEDAITGRVIHTAAPVAGSFACSNELINKIQHNITWGQRSNMYSVPTDCPQRDERLGWMGDAQIFANTSCWNMDMALFYSKWMNDISDCQLPDGATQNVNPAIVAVGPASPAWGDAVVIIPWVVYQHYGDTRIIEQHFDNMVRWVEYMRANSRDGLFERDGFGDWIAPVPSPKNTISAAYFFYDCVLLSKMARAIGRDAEAEEYSNLSREIARAFNAKFLDRETNNYPGATQTANVLPLYFGIVPDDRRAAVAANVVRDIKARGNHLSTGFLGTAYLLPVLTDTGHNDVAYSLATQTTYPSWGYMVEKGATTIWELWDSDTKGPEMNSRNHFALGAVGEWFYQVLAGIQIDPENPGFKHIIIRPQPVGDLKWARAHNDTPYGRVAVAWQFQGHDFRMEVTVPANTSATIHVPTFGKRTANIMEGDKPLVRDGSAVGGVDGITFQKVDSSFAVFEAGAGTYVFVVEGVNAPEP